jgi:hypothetical protein
MSMVLYIVLQAEWDGERNRWHQCQPPIAIPTSCEGKRLLTVVPIQQYTHPHATSMRSSSALCSLLSAFVDMSSKFGLSVVYMILPIHGLLIEYGRTYPS